MKEIKIKDFHKWSDIKTKDVKDDQMQQRTGDKLDENDIEELAPSYEFQEKIKERATLVGKRLDIDINYDTNKNVLRMKQKVQVTCHKITTFKNMFSDFFLSQL